MAAPYTKKDAAKDTGSTEGEVNRAWHNARNDAEGTDYEVREKKSYADNRNSRYQDEDEDG